jgi:hypothetical protein
MAEEEHQEQLDFNSETPSQDEKDEASDDHHVPSGGNSPLSHEKDIPLMKLELYHYLKYNKFPPEAYKSSTRQSLKKSAKNYQWQNDVLYKKHKSGRLLKVATPNDLPQIWATCHDQGHPGQRTTWIRVSRTYWWESMERDCYDYVRRCEHCQKEKGKAIRTDRELHPIPVTAIPFQKLGIDLAGPLPKTKQHHKYLLVIIDYLTKWVEAIPLHDNTSGTVAKVFYQEIICRHGCPLEVTTDGGPSFLNEFLRSLEGWNIEAIKISPYNPQANGLVERVIQTFKSYLERCTGHKPYEWDLHLASVLLTYRNTPQASTKYSPYYLLYGRESVLPEQVHHLLKAPNRKNLMFTNMQNNYCM